MVRIESRSGARISTTTFDFGLETCQANAYWNASGTKGSLTIERDGGLRAQGLRRPAPLGGCRPCGVSRSQRRTRQRETRMRAAKGLFYEVGEVLYGRLSLERPPSFLHRVPGAQRSSTKGSCGRWRLGASARSEQLWPKHCHNDVDIMLSSSIRFSWSS